MRSKCKSAVNKWLLVTEIMQRGWVCLSLCDAHIAALKEITQRFNSQKLIKWAGGEGACMRAYVYWGS